MQSADDVFWRSTTTTCYGMTTYCCNYLVINANWMGMVESELCHTTIKWKKEWTYLFCLKNVCLWFKFSCFKKGEGLDHFDTQETGWYSDLTRGRAFACVWGFPSVRAKEPVFLVHALSLYRVSLTWYYHWVIFCQPFMTKVDQVSFTEHCCHIHTLGSSIDWAKTEWPD